MSKQNELLALHGQLLAGDLRASSKIVECALARLVAIVEREVVGLHDKQDAEQACFDALFKYLASPGDYDPDRAELITYLAAIAKGKAMTLRRSQGRSMKRDGDYAATQELTRDPLAAPADEGEMVNAIDWVRFGGALVKEDGDAEVVALMKLGSATAAAVAQALGLAQDDNGHAEALRRIERIRGRARRIKERTEA